LQALSAHPSASDLAQFDFRLRAIGVVCALPLAALVVRGLALLMAHARRSLP
jgi:hypothetical protein